MAVYELVNDMPVFTFLFDAEEEGYDERVLYVLEEEYKDMIGDDGSVTINTEEVRMIITMSLEDLVNHDMISVDGTENEKELIEKAQKSGINGEFKVVNFSSIPNLSEDEKDEHDIYIRRLKRKK